MLLWVDRHMRRSTKQGPHRFERVAIAAVLALLPSCGAPPTAPDPGPVAELTFTSSTLDLSGDLQAGTSLRNVGTVAFGPITIAVGQLELGGVSVPGASVEASPAEVATLNPGASANVTVSVVSDVALQPGSYSARLDAVVAGRSEASIGLGFVVEAPAVDVASIEILGAPAGARQGDVVVLRAEARDGSGSTMDRCAGCARFAAEGHGLMQLGPAPGLRRPRFVAGAHSR